MAGIAIFNAQFRSPAISALQVDIFKRIYAAVTAKNVTAAEKAGRASVENLRKAVAQFF